MRLIDAECKELTETIGRIEFKTRKDILSWLDAAPTIDAEPVKHGHWVASITGHDVCSKCHAVFVKSYCGDIKPRNVYKHCPNCGAKMDEEDT